MLRRLSILPAFLLLLAAEKPTDSTESKGLPDGTWRGTSFKAGGKRIFEGVENLYTIEINKDQMVWKAQGSTVQTTTHKLDLSKKPAWIDITYTSGPGKGKTVKGIFEVKDDVLTFSHGSENGERPTSFDDPRGIVRSWKKEP
jgi:uncharacterized protein (TIGR03067 family)